MCNTNIDFIGWYEGIGNNLAVKMTNLILFSP